MNINDEYKIHIYKLNLDARTIHVRKGRWEKIDVPECFFLHVDDICFSRHGSVIRCEIAFASIEYRKVYCDFIRGVEGRTIRVSYEYFFSIQW